MPKKDKKSNVINIDPKNAAKLREKQKLSRKSIFELTTDKKIKTTSIKNVVLIIMNDTHLKNMFRFNEFTGEIDVVKSVTINVENAGTITINKGQYTDQVINSVELYIESCNKYNNAVFKNNVIDQGITNAAHMNSYNPLVDYMNDAYKNWDKKRRLDNFFSIYLGADHNATNVLITRQWFMEGIAKAYDPATKCDRALDLVGGQGIGKTTILQKIAPLGLYTDQFNTFTDKDDFSAMKNAFIVNDDEMTASNNASFEEIKKFITMQVFEYRRPYGHKIEKFPKKFIIARTTNEFGHLKDRSGDRRFMSIKCNPKKQKRSPVTELTDSYVKQLWGEAVWIYKNAKDPFELTAGQENLLKANREQFRYTTGLEDNLMDVLENDFKDKKFISNRELSIALFDDPEYLSRNNKETRDVRYYMGHEGFVVGAVKKNKGKAIRGFAK
jgi:predicted P-loop ATPase